MNHQQRSVNVPELVPASWPRLEAGECLSLFTAKDESSGPAGLRIRWAWRENGGFDPRAHELVRGFELQEAFQTCVEIGDELLAPARSPRGLFINDWDAHFLETNRYVISGGSLGLALLLGLIGYARRVPPIPRCFVWGAIRPIRNDSFSVVPVGDIEGKLRYASMSAPSMIIHPRAEALHVPRECRDVGISEPIKAAWAELNAVLQDEVVHVH
jgi:hypothetical protein